jgi:hypothetical protein
METLMELNNIQLTPSLVAELYKNVLVDSGKPEEESVHPIKTAPTLATEQAGENFLGANQKNILIIVQHISISYLPDDELNFLTTILSACNLTLADVAIVNIGNTSPDYKTLLDRFKSRVVFLFGPPPAAIGLPIDFPTFQVQAFSKATFLFAPSLAECAADKLLKSKLWVCLKRIFVI